MPARAESQMTGLFDQAVQTFGDALKAGVKIQEEVAKWWSDMLDQAGPVQEWQSRSRALVNEAIPTAQKSAEEYLRVLEQNYRRSMDLVKKAFDSNGGSASSKDVQARTRELWEASLEVVRDNAQAMARVNVDMMETWSELLRKNIAATTQMTQKTTAAVARAAASK